MDTSKDFSLMLDSAIRQHPNIFKNFDRTKNVQDQLQNMIGDKLGLESLILGLHQQYCDDRKKEGYGLTMEQLWLAFVMKEKYNKKWNGKEWE